MNPSDWVTDDKSGESVNVTEAVMLNDTRFWKALRKSWYSVLIEGIMKDYEAKKKLARAFMKHYHRLMDDFVNDDQEDDYTITNMSLQACFLNTFLPSLIFLIVPLIYRTSSKNDYHQKIIWFSLKWSVFRKQLLCSVFHGANDCT